MFFNIIIALGLLLITTLVMSRFLNFHKNIWVLFIAQPLAMSASPVIVFIGGILSSKMASDPSLATLPITVMVLGVASASIPAAMLAKNKGRKFATLTGFSLTLFAALTAMLAATKASFELFLLASLFFGFSTAFIQQLRFSAIESVDKAEDIPKVLSILMLSGLFAAFIGPEVALAGKDLLDSPYGYAGSFMLLAILAIAAILVGLVFRDPEQQTTVNHSEVRPLGIILKQPIFIISILTAAIGYALMSYLMTATPLSMHHMHGHSLQETKWVIQSHIAAMFIPSLFTAWLVKKFGIKSLLLSGTVIYAIVAVIALSGEQVLHYWWALILLGIGWNFLFLTGTTLLPLSYNAGERHKVQATNDFILFGFQAFASLMAGWMLFKAGWHAVVLSSLPFIIALFFITLHFYRREAKINKLEQVTEAFIPNKTKET
ncbi:MAG: MFS family permease [Alteromonadaceae bacterium]|jgi:MFS family permease